MRRALRATQLGMLVAAAATLLAGCSLGGRSNGTEVVLVGDSIAHETAPYLRDALGDDVTLHERFLGGTAPCDWVDMDLQMAERHVVVVSFIGNSLTECMADGAGGHLRGEALVERYRADLTTLVDRIRATGARVVLVGQPPRGPGSGASSDIPDEQLATEIEGINSIYLSLAAAGGDDVSFVDAGAALEHDDGTYATELPCLPDEDECGPGGVNPVRNADGVHLCPGDAGSPCPVHSSGALRFARAIAGAVEAVVPRQ